MSYLKFQCLKEGPGLAAWPAPLQPTTAVSQHSPGSQQVLEECSLRGQVPPATLVPSHLMFLMLDQVPMKGKMSWALRTGQRLPAVCSMPASRQPRNPLPLLLCLEGPPCLVPGGHTQPQSPSAPRIKLRPARRTSWRRQSRDGVRASQPQGLGLKARLLRSSCTLPGLPMGPQASSAYLGAPAYSLGH